MATIFQQDKVTDIKQAVHVMEEKIKTVLSTNEIPAYDKKDKILRLSIEIPEISLLSWLVNQKSHLKIYWSDRENKFETVGIEAADYIGNGIAYDYRRLFGRIHTFIDKSEDNVRYYGGFRFTLNQTIEEKWLPFGHCYFVLPRFELFKTSGKTFFVSNLFIKRDKQKLSSILSQLNNLVFLTPERIANVPKVISRHDTPGKDDWVKMIDSSLKAFNDHRYEKIVLARKTSLTFSNHLNPLIILHKLINKTTNCYHFCFQPKDSLAFIGASPERLYFRQGKQLQCEALAGTRPRSQSEKQDNKYGEELLKNEKEIREHHYVIDSLVEAFAHLTDKVVHEENSPVTLLKLARVQHLISRYHLELKKNISDSELLSALHPTAAVGGYPKDKVIDEIKHLEGFDRGWYAAPVGWVSQESAEFAVAIRCGLIKDNKLDLYSGAGIVKGSTADSEWDEIENKISNFLKALS